MAAFLVAMLVAIPIMAKSAQGGVPPASVGFAVERRFVENACPTWSISG